MSNIVQSWFDADFSQLHPLLQQLHIDGGVLTGDVDLEYGSGMLGWFGRRMGKKLGLPRVSGRYSLVVTIEHRAEGLVWARKFDDASEMVSVFKPHGQYPTGTWTEKTGKVVLRLGVMIKDGGWHWVQKGVSVCGIPMPLWLLPTPIASKSIINEQYEFSVSFLYPRWGSLLSYSGCLQLDPSV